LSCPVTYGFDHSLNGRIIFCGGWRCSNCAKRLAGKWAKRAELGLLELSEGSGHEAWFLTLTLGARYKTPHDGFVAIPRLWDTTRKAFQRWYGAFTYLAAVEGQRQRDAMPHFHILTTVEPPWPRGKRGYVTKHGVHDFAVAYGWGHQAELEIVSNAQAAVYIAKYASKGDPAMPRNFRRMRVSADWPALPDMAGSPLLVPARDEDIAHYIARVADETGSPPEEVYSAYTALIEKFREAKEGGTYDRTA